MTHEVAIDTNAIPSPQGTSLSKRGLVLVYGVTGALVGLVSLLWLILAMGGLAPTSIGPLHSASTSGAIAINVGLVVLFGLQHSIMARPGFKATMRRWMPQATERATFLLLTGLTLMFVIAYWQPLPGLVWQVENTGLMIGLWALFGMGWAYLLLSTFATNHFEFMGLRQTYFYVRNLPYSKLKFTNKYMYSYSRHPMMLGLLLGMWCVPVMSVSQFVMASLLTLYVFIGMFFEERDLINEFGDAYKKYKNEVAALIPKIY